MTEITQDDIDTHGSALNAMVALDWDDAGEAMTNCSDSIHEDVVARLDQGNAFAQYSAWNFCGYVWHDADGYACEVWVHRAPRKVMRAATPRELMTVVSDQYGWA